MGFSTCTYSKSKEKGGLQFAKESELTAKTFPSDIIPEKGLVSRGSLVYNAVSDVLYIEVEDKKADQPKPIFRLDKPPGVPPPKTLGEARKSAWWEGYRRAITEEITNLETLGCWEVIEITDVPRGTNILRSKFVFDDKRDSDGKLLKFKARLVAMGFTQIEGVDYDDTFASVMTTKSFRTLLVIWNLDKKHTMEHWDIKQAFVNAPLSQTLYMHPVSGFGLDGKILKLRKALYGTKQAAREWQIYLKKS